MEGRTDPRRVGARLLVGSILLIAIFGASCRNEQPTDDLDYLVWEVCRQATATGVTAYEVAGILQDASRHGAVMDRIKDECGDEIAAVFATTSGQ